jgi:hypothetical protein
MVLRRRLVITIVTIVIGAGLLLSILHLLPLSLFSVQQKPEQKPQPMYEYYIIYDEKTGQELMYVPLVVSIGDELISEDNKRYRIVKIIENRAYARFIEDINIP